MTSSASTRDPQYWYSTLFLKRLTCFIHISDVATKLHTTVDLSKYDPECCTQH